MHPSGSRATKQVWVVRSRPRNPGLRSRSRSAEFSFSDYSARIETSWKLAELAFRFLTQFWRAIVLPRFS